MRTAVALLLALSLAAIVHAQGGIASAPAKFLVAPAQVVAIRAGRATLELINPAQRRLIDQLEVGHEVSRKFRVAFEVDDSAAATERLVAGGAELIAPPTWTPWGSLNARLEGPAGLQLTLFQELGSPE